MEGKVLLYDSNNVKIGETFFRRAKQLVKKQRAIWVDEHQDAIRFAPGMEHMHDSITDDFHEEVSVDFSGADDELLKLAKRRVYSRFAFKLHSSIVLVICVFLTLIHLFTNPAGFFWPIFPITGLGFSVAIHWLVNKLVNEGMASQIAQEYEELKHLRMYGKNEDIRG